VRSEKLSLTAGCPRRSVSFGDRRRVGTRALSQSIATARPLVLYESGFAPRWYVVRADIDESELTAVDLEPGQTVIPHGPDRELTVAEALPRKEP
jgi:uncharacterized protein (DUF427 family)